MKNIPNILSVIRLFLAGVFAVTFSKHRFVLSVSVFLLAGITDIVDGILARKFGWITDLGKILDPIADKTMQFTALVCLVVEKFVPLWLLCIIFVKEALTGIGSLVFYNKFKTISVSKMYGKAYTVLFYIAVALLIIFKSWFNANLWAEQAVCILLAVMGIFAIAMYYVVYLKGKLRKANKERQIL